MSTLTEKRRKKKRDGLKGNSILEKFRGRKKALSQAKSVGKRSEPRNYLIYLPEKSQTPS